MIDSTGAESMEHWHPASAGHIVDPRLRQRLMNEPGLKILMVHRAAMASSNPATLILTGKGAVICSRVTLLGTWLVRQMAPHVEGTVPCLWLETTTGDYLVEDETRDGVIWQDWNPPGHWVDNLENRS